MKFLCAILPTLLLGACGQPEPITYEALSWVNNYYVEHPVQSLTPTAGGWLFRGARDNGQEIRVGFLVPGSLNPDPVSYTHLTLPTRCHRGRSRGSPYQ